MKKNTAFLPIFALLTLALPFSPTKAFAGNGADDWVTLIRQIQVVTGVEYIQVVPPVGQGASMVPLEEGGAAFELWAIQENNEEGLTEVLVDSKLVDAYMPSASIRIITEDPYPGVPRTRADRPFSVEFDIAGLVPGAAVTAASQVPLKHVGFSYSQPPFIPANRIDNHQFYSGFANQNGVLRWDFPMTNLDGEDPRHVTGVERFSVHVLPDLDAPSDQLAQAEIQIFPLTGISVSGIDQGATYRQPPVVLANYTHLYPESVTWAQVYPGPPQLGTEGTAVPGSFIVISDDVTQHRDATMSSLQSVVQQDGQWTFEILTETPFGIERLYHTHFNLESILRVDGVIVTSESDD